jgi:hypothetical protein
MRAGRNTSSTGMSAKGIQTDRPSAASAFYTEAPGFGLLQKSPGAGYSNFAAARSDCSTNGRFAVSASHKTGRSTECPRRVDLGQNQRRPHPARNFRNLARLHRRRAQIFTVKNTALPTPLPQSICWTNEATLRSAWGKLESNRNRIELVANEVGDHNGYRRSGIGARISIPIAVASKPNPATQSMKFGGTHIRTSRPRTARATAGCRSPRVPTDDISTRMLSPSFRKWVPARALHRGAQFNVQHIFNVGAGVLLALKPAATAPAR